MAANIFTNGAGGNAWTTAGNWSLGAVPLAGDGNVATFDASSPACTVSSGNKVCNGVDFTNYVNTITLTGNIQVSGNATLGTGMTFAGSGQITMAAAGTITSNGKAFTNFGNINSNVTYTLADAMVITGNWAAAASGTFGIFNGFTITVGGNLINSTGAYVGGTSNIIMNGTGTISGLFNGNTINFNTSGIITFGATFNINGVTVTYTSGTLLTSDCALTMIGTNTVDFNYGSFSSLSHSLAVGGNHTLTTDLYIIGNVTTTSTSGLQYNGGNLYIGGGLTFTPGSNSIQGTSTIIFNGTGTINFAGFVANANCFISNNLTIDTAGTITFGSNFPYKTGTFTYLRGIVKATTATLILTAAATLINMNQINWLGVTITNAVTITMNKFFSGSAKVPTTVTCASPTLTYNIQMQDGFEKISKFINLSNCVMINTTAAPSNVRVITSQSNKGRNTGLYFVNNKPNGIPRNMPTVPTQIGYNCGGYIDDPIKLLN
jgi:hypothetical protein